MHRKMKALSFVLLIVVLNHSSATIPFKEKVSPEEFATFPLFRDIDRFSQCIAVKGGAYCSANFHLVSDGPNELLDRLQNLSFSAPRHFDYTNPQYGYCITQRCKEFYKGDSDAELLEAMGLCLNHTLEQEYGLRARINYTTCYRHGESKHTVTWLDCVAALIFLSIIGLVVVGTLYDVLATNRNPNSYLLSFSLPANWKQLKAPSTGGKMIERLVGTNGLRSINALMVIFTHASLPLHMMIENPYQVEERFESTVYQFIGHSGLAMHTYFMLSGMFLTYSTQISNGGKRLIWRSLPKAIFFRWYRFAPVYLLTILFCATWYKFLPYGPFWQEIVNDEVHDCQAHWMPMVFFYINYFPGTQCNPHQWSTALDLQMYAIGLILLALPTEKIRDSVIYLLYVITIITPGFEVYFRDMDGIMMATGKVTQGQRIFVHYDFFNIIHKRTHTNMSSYLMGMVFGLFLYKWMQKPIDFSQYKKYGRVYLLIFPLILWMWSLNSLIFLKEGERASVSIRILYAVLLKPLWHILIICLLMGMICRVENLYRGVLEWSGWSTLVRLTFCTYNVHMIVIRWVFGADTQLTPGTDFHLMIKSMGFIVLTFALALVVWLFVEAPFNNLIKRMGKKSVLEVDSGKKTE